MYRRRCGGTPYTCGAPDQCHQGAGTCNGNGTCSFANQSDGTTCNDGNACTRPDTCRAGTCTGSNPVVCSASDQCHDVGTCDVTTGACSHPPSPTGKACSDGDACTQSDFCDGAGSCVGTNFWWSGVLQPINSDGSSIFKLGSTIG